MNTLLFQNRWLCVVRALAMCAGLACAIAVSSDGWAAKGWAQPSSGSYRIAGTVVSKADGRPLGEARVTATDVHDGKKSEFRITGEDGKFEFTNVPAGKYSLRGAKRGYIAAAYDQHGQFSSAIVTGAGLDTETLQLRLAPDAVIAGKVLDEAGEAVRKATVTVYHEDHSSGESRIRPGASAQTDDRGEYEITPLQPGNYFVSVTAKPWYAMHPATPRSGWLAPANEASGEPASESSSSESSSSESSSKQLEGALDRSLFDVTYPVTYYPDVVTSESAIPIPIQGGERLQLDFHLNPVPSLRLMFRVPKGENGEFNVPNLEQPAFDGVNYVQSQSTHMISPGLWEVSGIPAGNYNVVIHSQAGPQQLSQINLAKDGEEIDTDTGKSQPLAKIKATIQMADNQSPPRLTVSMREGSRQVAGASTQTSGTSKNENSDELEFDSIPPGKYEFSVFGQGNRYFVSRLSATGAEVSGRTLMVTAGSSPTVRLTVVSGSADVEGVVRKSGQAFSGAMVVLVPANPETDSDLFRRDQSDQDGTFVLHNVIAGAYTILAIEDGWEMDWSRAGVISVYLKGGRKIEVTGASSKAIRVEEPIEVQSR